MKTPKHGYALTAAGRLRATIGLSPSSLVRLGLKPDAWRQWDQDFGPWWRVAHGIGRPADLERVQSEPAPAGELPPPPGA
jgi:hypothetical protein